MLLFVWSLRRFWDCVVMLLAVGVVMFKGIHLEVTVLG